MPHIQLTTPIKCKLHKNFYNSIYNDYILHLKVDYYSE